MILAFKTLDDAQWRLDLDSMIWEQNLGGTKTTGKILFHTPGMHYYSLDGRTPKDGLCAVGVIIGFVGENIIFYLTANVKVKNFSIINFKNIFFDILPSAKEGSEKTDEKDSD